MRGRAHCGPEDSEAGLGCCVERVRSRGGEGEVQERCTDRTGCWPRPTGRLLLSPQTPGATPNAGWEGNIQATKWRNEEGNVHDGCKGKNRDKTKAFTFYKS